MSGFASGYDLVMGPVEAVYLRNLRRSVFGGLSGRVLELGAGTGANLTAYGAAARVTGTDQSEEMLDQARGKAPAPLAAMDAAHLGFADASFDAVTASLVLCSVPDPQATLAEVRRVLRPGGRLLLLEHVRGSHGFAARLTDALDVPWYGANGSCHLNRDTEAEVARAGFHIAAAPRRLFGYLQTIDAVS